ncbi:MAG: DUF4012 domain-containing protein [Patescibacteria group bacterium]|jgi:hypothetical protein
MEEKQKSNLENNLEGDFLELPVKKTVRQKTKKSLVKSQRTKAEKKAKQLLNQPVETKIDFNLDHFLVDEQVQIYKEIQNLESNKTQQTFQKDFLSNQPTVESIPTHRQELQNSLKSFLNKKSFSVFLDKKGGLSGVSPKALPKNSAHTLNLKKSASAQFTKPAKFKPSLVFGQNNFEELPLLDAPTLLKKRTFVEIVADFVKFSRGIFPTFRFKPSYKKLSSQPITTTSFYWFNLKNTLYFALIALLFIVPMRSYFIYSQVNKSQVKVLGATEEAIQQVKDGLLAVGAQDWQKAGFNFNLANDYFSQAAEVLNSYNQSILNFLENIPVASGKINGGKHLIAAGQLLTQAGSEISQTVALAGGTTDVNSPLDQNFAILKQGLAMGLEHLKEALNNLDQVDAHALPKNYRPAFTEIKSQLPVLFASLDQANELLNFTYDVLGYQTAKRYLLVFQNTNERKATGGFMGSYALADIVSGKISNLEVPPGGLYDLKQDFQASGEKVLSPKPMHLLGTPWMPWDANWSPDVPTSMNKLLWFYYKSGGPTVDGVILINSNLMPEILKISGNVILPQYDQVLTPENVILALQHETEFEYDKISNQPKKIIGDLFKVVLERLTSGSASSLPGLLAVFGQGLNSKDVQLYFTDSAMEQRAKAFNWAGEIKQANQDYLAVINTNIGGGKSNSVLSEQIDHYAHVLADGSIIDTVSVTLNHYGNKNDVFERVQNNAYIRVYVPQGAKLQEASGYSILDQSLFKEPYEGYMEDPDLSALVSNQQNFGSDGGVVTYDELNKSVMAAWLQLNPGESQTLTFSYLLPFKLDFKSSKLNQILSFVGFNRASAKAGYSLLVQKQSGATQTNLSSHLVLPNNWGIVWSGASNGQQVKANPQGADFSVKLDQDYLYSVLLKK